MIFAKDSWGWTAASLGDSLLEMEESPQEVTQLLQAWSRGEQGALDKLAPVVYRELHRLAQRYMAQERPGQTLQATALVNEAYLRLVDVKQVSWQNRAHFFGVLGAIHAAHPGGAGTRAAHAEARQRGASRYTR
jgi:hypothetical protein